MPSSKVYLELSGQLPGRGVEFPFEAGKRIARGYADLGVEEFELLGASKMLSLFTGQISTLTSDHKQFFYRVPDTDEIIEELVRRGALIEGLFFPEAREWMLRFEWQGKQWESRARALPEALLKGLLLILPPDTRPRAEPRLKAERM